MSRNSELRIMPTIIAASLAFNLGSVIGRLSAESHANADQRVAEVQAHNEQIKEQLIPTYRGLGHLVLDDKTDTFVFHINSTDFPDQSCKGSFEVKHHEAVAIGNIACTEQHKVGSK